MANASAIWQHNFYAAHTTTYNTHLLTAPTTTTTTTKRQEPPKRAYLSENGGLGKKRLGEWAQSRKG